MIKKERSNFSNFEENRLDSSEQQSVQGGKLPLTGKDGTPVTRTGTKPPKNPLSTQNNGDPKPIDPLDIGLILDPFQQQP